jgi:predicted  nucleic acid-binding Zn-ribbon protein
LDIAVLELSNLRDELRDVENDRDDLQDELENADEQWNLEKWKHRKLKAEFTEKVEGANSDLSHKVCTYYDVIQEYEGLVEKYVAQTGVRLVTNKIIELRQRGDLQI